MESENKAYLKGLLTGILSGIIVVLLVIVGMNLKKVADVTNENRISKEESGENEAADFDDIISKMQAIYKNLDNLYLGEMDLGKMEDAVCKAMVSSLGDVYTVYYNTEELNAMMETVTGSYCGIGIAVGQDSDTNQIFVTSVFSKGPAQEAGVRVGDEIISIDGKKIADNDLDTVVSWVKGEKGSSLTMTVKRKEKTLKMDMIRNEVEIDTVYSKMLEDKIGYIQISEFDEITMTQFQEAVENLKKEGMEKVVIDLRNNPGGRMDVVCDIANTFLEKDKLIIYTEDKKGKKEEEYSNREGELIGMPMVTLVNKNSASASELFAGVVKDYGLGKVVGTQTFGKGIAQRLVHLPGGTSALKITYSKYYSPGGVNIHEVGVTPDEVVKLPGGAESIYEMEAGAEDTQLKKAMELLK